STQPQPPAMARCCVPRSRLYGRCRSQWKYACHATATTTSATPAQIIARPHTPTTSLPDPSACHNDIGPGMLKANRRDRPNVRSGRVPRLPAGFTGRAARSGGAPRLPYTLEGVTYTFQIDDPSAEPPFQFPELWFYLRFTRTRATGFTRRFGLQVFVVN